MSSSGGLRQEVEALKKVDLLAWLTISVKRKEDWGIEKAISEVLQCKSAG